MIATYSIHFSSFFGVAIFMWLCLKIVTLQYGWFQIQAVFSKNGVSRKADFPPLTLALCDSGRDSHAWNPHQCLWSWILNTNQTKKQQLQGWRRDTPGDCRMHGCKVINAGSNAYNCVLLGWTQTKEALFYFSPVGGDTKIPCNCWYRRAPVVKQAVNWTAFAQKLFPRSFRPPDCETHSPGKIGHWRWRETLKSVSAYSKFWSTKSHWHFAASSPWGLTGRGTIIDPPNPEQVFSQPWTPHCLTSNSSLFLTLNISHHVWLHDPISLCYSMIAELDSGVLWFEYAKPIFRAHRHS